LLDSGVDEPWDYGRGRSSLTTVTKHNKGAKPARPRRTRSDRLLSVLSEFEQVLIVTHDNPDPDAIASGWGLLRLFAEKLKIPCRFVAGGAVVRAENRRLLEILRPPIEFVEEIETSDNVGVLLVDTIPTAANHLLRGGNVYPIAVIDHHEPESERFPARFRDIRPKLAATATIVGQYLRAQDTEPSADLATALAYAIRTDAVGVARFSRSDHQVLNWLGPFVAHDKLANIEAAPLPLEYFADLLLALQNTYVYKNAALCFLPQANGVEIVGEVADALIRCQTIDRALCGAVVEDEVLLSVRTSPAGGDASELVRGVLARLGRGGGHQQRAGGKISRPVQSGRINEELQAELRARWLRVCGVDQQRGKRLVAPRQIVQNL